MKISISQIAWAVEEDAAVHSLLEERGVTALELAPTRTLVNGLDVVTPSEVEDLRASFGRLRPVAMQALLFGKPDLVLFGEAGPRAAAMNYLKKVVDLAAALGVGPMVFGSPKNRLRGAMSMDEARRIAVPFFAELGDYAATRGPTIALEPNPAAYGCDFLNSITEVVDFVQAVDSKGCAAHWDSGCILLNGEDPLELLPVIAPHLCHYHISQPYLEDFSILTFPHQECARILREAGYDGHLSIEMKRSPRGLDAIREALDLAISL